MALPKLAIPEYECELPVSNLKVKYRPFLVKEEKLLYLAMESQKEKEMVNAVKTIIKNCTDLKVNLNKIPTFEIEYLFLRIRAKAVGEISEFTVTCPDDEKTTVDVKLPLESIEIQQDENHSKEIKLDDKVGIVMQYPSLDLFVDQNLREDPNIEDMFKLAAQCIEKVYDEEEVYDKFTLKEALDFIGELNSEQFQKIQDFFDTIPKLRHELTVTNPKTNVESTIPLEGLAAFFG
tara:strand:+ start:18251 stop:18955 length:705 start_codon:yes stop_codon:yes gene_type:complete